MTGCCSIRLVKDKRKWRWHGKSDLMRLEEKIERIPFSTCWWWTAAVNANGYACVWNGVKVEEASRLSFKLHIGPIPPKAFLCHHCDNPLCVRPDHLYIGTHQQNMLDRDRRGRGAGIVKKSKGEENIKAKLSEDEVLAIRGTDIGSRTLAEAFGVNRTTIQQIRARKTWRHL